MICIVCPIGCNLEVEFDEKNKKVLSVKGNSCNRGIKYAEDEMINPTRVLTTTMTAFIGGEKYLVPVKTNAAIPKSLLYDAMKLINENTINERKKIGDIVIENILDTGSDIVVTSSILQA